MANYDLIIIGGGVAGYAAGIYASRYELKVLLIEGPKPGGETATGGVFENYPGILSIEGYDLYQQFKKHAESVSVEVKPGTVSAIAKDRECLHVTVDRDTYQAVAVIFAHGQSRRHLRLPREDMLTGKGISYCVTCDGPLYKGKTVAVVGGGDASVKGVNLLAEYAKKIYLIVRDPEIRAEPVNYTRMKEKGERVEVLLETQVRQLLEEGGKFKGIQLSRPYKGSHNDRSGTKVLFPERSGAESKGNDILDVDGLFIEIGAEPETALPRMVGVELTDKGYIHVDQFMHTNVTGVFAAGDATDAAGSFRQAITAAAQGSVAATSAYEYIRSNGNRCELHAKPAPK